MLKISLQSFPEFGANNVVNNEIHRRSNSGTSKSVQPILKLKNDKVDRRKPAHRTNVLQSIASRLFLRKPKTLRREPKHVINKHRNRAKPEAKRVRYGKKIKKKPVYNSEGIKLNQNPSGARPNDIGLQLTTIGAKDESTMVIESNDILNEQKQIISPAYPSNSGDQLRNGVKYEGNAAFEANQWGTKSNHIGTSTKLPYINKEEIQTFEIYTEDPLSLHGLNKTELKPDKKTNRTLSTEVHNFNLDILPFEVAPSINQVMWMS